MARFIIEGMVVEEPATVTLPNGKTKYKKVRIEEKLMTADGKPYACVHEVRFFGKMMSKVPEGMDLTGCRAFIVGVLKSGDYSGRNYHDLYGDTFILESSQSFEPIDGRAAIQPEDMGDADLPF